MPKNFTCFVAGATLLAATGCAGSYHAIQPDRISTYQSNSRSNEPLEFSYQYSALQQHGGNKKYTKKEHKRGYQVVAIRLKNNTSTDLDFSRDLELSFGDRPIMPVPPVQAAHDLKQGVAIYALYTLLNFNVGGTTTTNQYTGQTTTTGGTFLPTGPFIAAGNMIGAGTANANLRREFVRYDMANKVIHPGETVYGIISLRETNVAPLRLSLRNNSVTIQPNQAAPSSMPAQSLPNGGGY
ncbi:hypothetical protein [Hymenobacter crusticola]|uniref:Uncharacterized protein n=1 Tax=Hymenobacter crusticola TaxID=1770526 RepID=A0A243WAV6_9BACT|nr:hypothetical protein [Hymenobacter crusticola]OUJ72510.1 hypothetical protein BXP70_18295 [Hymenobacter crusticola]